MLAAFFLEATFLGILLFGGDRVPRWLHVFSAIAVAVGHRDLGFLDPVRQQLDAHADRA